MPPQPDGPYFDHHHAVQFYGDESGLFTTVSGFLGQGFLDGHPAILIATPAHTTAILEHLKGRLIDVDKAQTRGDLVVLDAHDTLARFMDGNTPNPDRFESSVGTVVADVARSHGDHKLIRAYGEMVDVLWKEGRPEAAVRLEMLWNKLATRHGFALLCGYAMGNFFNETRLFEEVCRQHTHVMPSVASMPAPPPRLDLQ